MIFTDNESIRARLYAAADPAYGEFTRKLIPTVPAERILGVRTPLLRQTAKALRGTDEAKEFLHALPHTYFEENQLHAFLIEEIRDYDLCAAELERFLPRVDNWATCDQMAPKVLTKDLPRTERLALQWMASDHPYTVRYGVGGLMRWFLADRFRIGQAEAVAALCGEEYYVNMMIAWYFATALAKQYDAVLPFFLSRRLSPWVHRKALQKATESDRIPDERKTYLKTLKRTGGEKFENC